MKRHLKPEHSIRIPLEFLKKIDRVTMEDIRMTELLSLREEIPQRISLVSKQAVSSSLGTRQLQQTLSLQRLKEEESRQKSVKVRFRTTGAGFRQRKQEPPPKERVPRSTQTRSTPRIQPPSQPRKEIIRLKTRVVQNRQESKKYAREMPKRCFFGEQYSFREQEEFQYSEGLAFDEFQWQGEAGKYKRSGFGVAFDLSRFDIQSLLDPQGLVFMQHQEEVGFCPIFTDNGYDWEQIKVEGFDAKTNRVVVNSGDKKWKVSRLSIRFQGQDVRKYWERVSAARRLSRNTKEEEKYSRYLAARDEYFNLPAITGLYFSQKVQQIAQRQWFIPYSRQFVVFKEMALKPQKFQAMGLKLRGFEPFKQKAAAPAFQDFKMNRQGLSRLHYSRFPKFFHSLEKLYERLDEECCRCLRTDVWLLNAEEVQQVQCDSVVDTCKRVAGRTRQLLLSDIFGELAFAFKGKQEEKKYLRVHNLIFQQLIHTHLYQGNVARWLRFLASSLTWTAQTPKPLVRLKLLANKSSGFIQTEPSLTILRDALLIPLVELERLVKDIPDILSEIGETACIKIRKSLLPFAKQKIAQVTSKSFAVVDQYCVKLTDKLLYLGKFNKTKEAFNKQGIAAYESYLELLRSDLQTINHSVIGRTGLLSVDASALKESLQQGLSKHRVKFGKSVQQQIEEELQSIGLKFKQKQQALRQIPRDEQQLVQMRAFLLGECQDFLEEAGEHYLLCQGFYQICEDNAINLNFGLYQKATESILQQHHLTSAINSKLMQLNKIEQDMIEAINVERDAILRGLQELSPQIDTIAAYGSLAQLSQCYVITSRTYHSLQGYQQQLKRINYREKVLKQEISVFPLIAKLQRILKPYFDLWNLAYALTNLVISLRTDPIHSLIYDQLKIQTAECSKELQRLLTIFSAAKNVAAVCVAQALSEKIAFSEEQLWVVRSFTLEGVLKKEGLRKDITAKIFGAKQIKFTELTLDGLIESGVQVHRDFVEQNAEKAERIWRLEQRVAGIVAQSKKLQFQFTQQLGTPIVEEAQLLALSSAVHEQLEMMETIRDLQEANYIQKRVSMVQNRLAIIEDTLMQMICFQKDFFPLLGLMKLQEISREMGREFTTFSEVQRIWRSLSLHLSKDPQLWEAIETDSHKNRLENLSKMMAQVDRKLNEVIDLKRQSFPRLFFLTHAQIRHLLLCPSAIRPFLPRLFSGVQGLLFRGELVSGIIGSDGQYIRFKKNCGSSVLWQWLRFVGEETGKIVQLELNFKANKAQKYAFGKATRLMCEWTLFIEESIASRGLSSLLEKINKQIEPPKDLSTSISLSVLISFRDKTLNLLAQNVAEISNFEWKKEARYYMTEGSGVELKILTQSLPFRDQYPGRQLRALACLSDRVVLHTLTLSWLMNTGLMLQRNTSQTVRQICGMTMRHYVECWLNAQTQPQSLLYLLKGHFCSDSWVLLTSQEAFARPTFEVLAQACFQAHSAVQSGRALIYVGGDSFTLPKSFRFNLFLNTPSTKIQERSIKYGAVFRSVSWSSPSQAKVCSFKLECMGVKQAERRQIIKLHDYLSNELGRQWHCQSFAKAVDRLFSAVLVNPKDALHIFAAHWGICLSSEHQAKVKAFLNFKQDFIELSHLITQVEKGRQKKWLLVVGQNLSGKEYHIRNSFAALNIQVKEQLQHQSGSLDEWECLSLDYFTPLIPQEQKLIVRASSTALLTPAQVNRFVVFYHTKQVDWTVLACSPTIPFMNQEIQKEVQRQLTILFSLPQLNKTNKAIFNAFTLSFLKFVAVFCSNKKITINANTHKLQLVFMLLFWQTLAFFPSLIISPVNFGSNASDPLSYYYDLDKGAWLEWTTFASSHFSRISEKLSNLFLPTHETAAFLHFFTCTLPNINTWISSEGPGIGLHRAIRRCIREGQLQRYRTHKDADSCGISRLLTHSIAVFKRQGRFFPKLGKCLTVCVEDVGLPHSEQLDCFLRALFNNSYEKDRKRLLGRCSFICTVYDGGDDKLAIGIGKNIVRLRALSPSSQSAATIFGYYLEWFFGNTENPFSKQVRQASPLIVQLALKCYPHTHFSALVRVFEGLCQCSPKTVKSTQDILHLWIHESRFALDEPSSPSLVNGVLHQVYDNLQGFDPAVRESFKMAMKTSGMYVKIQRLSVEYSQNYRRVQQNFLHSQMTIWAADLDFHLLSHFPLVFFTSFLHRLARLLRVLSLPGRHILFYGAKDAGKSMLVRIAAMIRCGGDTDMISNVLGWRKTMSKNLAAMHKKEGPHCLGIKLGIDLGEEFVTAIEEIMLYDNPRSLVMHEQAELLEQLAICSPSSQQFLRFTDKIGQNIHCCLMYPSSDLTPLRSYPCLLRKVELLNVYSDFGSEAIQSIASVSVGKFHADIGIFQRLTKVLIEQGVEVTQGRLMRIGQLANHNYDNCVARVLKEDKQIQLAIAKVRTTEHHQKQLEEQLLKATKQLEKAAAKAEELRIDLKDFEEQYQIKVQTYNEHHQECEAERAQTQAIRVEVDCQMGKVLPMLTAAEQAMAKVSRDDINQLRSFPSPPLPAAKVVESLVFLFDEAHLVKEKVLQSGQKVRDFWQYAKKMILNDRLLKRVEEFKPDTIKLLDKTIITTLKDIIRKPQFIEERVFKASGAAGNLSLWIRAILAVYDVMIFIQPKKRLLAEAEEALSLTELHLQSQREELDKFHAILLEKKKNYELKLEEKEKVARRIAQLNHFLKNAARLLKLLHCRQKEWILRRQQLKKILEMGQLESILAAVCLVFIASITGAQRSKVEKRVSSLLVSKEKKYTLLCFEQYQQKLSFLNSQLFLKGGYLPLQDSITQSVIWLHQLLKNGQKIIFVQDNSIMASYLSHTSTASQFGYNVRMIDCMLRDFNDLCEELAPTQLEEQSDQQEQKKENEVTVLINIEHRPQLLQRMGQMLRKCLHFQLVVVVAMETKQFSIAMKQERLRFDIITQETHLLRNYFIKQVFNLPIEEHQQLKKTIKEYTLRLELMTLLCSSDNMILNQEIYEKWVELDREETEMIRSAKPIKRVGKTQEEKIGEIIELLQAKRTISLFRLKDLTAQYQSQSFEGIEKGLFHFSQWLKQRLSNWPDSLVKIVNTVQGTNSLAFYLLKLGKMQELQRISKGKQKGKDDIKGLNISCEVIDPASLLHCLRRNQHAFVCLTDKRKLKVALKECRIVQEHFKTEYLQQFLQREEQHFVYLLSECDPFPAEELAELEKNELTTAITYGQWNGVTFNEAYHMQRVHRKYQSLTPKQKDQIRVTIFHK